MLAQGEQGYVTKTPGKPMGSSDDTPGWCPLPRLNTDLMDGQWEGDLLADFNARLETLGRRIEEKMNGDDEDDGGEEGQG